MGASAAANCHPCMDHHLAKCDKLGIDREEVAAGKPRGGERDSQEGTRSAWQIRDRELTINKTQ